MSSPEKTSNPLVGLPVHGANLVNYQEGSVVSRTVIDKKVGTVTMFAFAKEQGLSEHTAPYDAFVYILDGTGTVNINGTDHEVKQDEFIIMPANIPHSLRANQQFKMMLVMIRQKAEA